MGPCLVGPRTHPNRGDHATRPAVGQRVGAAGRRSRGRDAPCRPGSGWNSSSAASCAAPSCCRPAPPTAARSDIPRVSAQTDRAIPTGRRRSRTDAATLGVITVPAPRTAAQAPGASHTGHPRVRQGRLQPSVLPSPSYTRGAILASPNGRLFWANLWIARSSGCGIRDASMVGGEDRDRWRPHTGVRSGTMGAPRSSPVRLPAPVPRGKDAPCRPGFGWNVPRSAPSPGSSCW
jgi:hypothetical protein